MQNLAGRLVRHYRRLSIKKKLSTVYISILMIPFALFFGLSVRSTVDSAVENAKAASVMLLEQTASNIDALLGSAVSVLRVVVANALVQEYFAPGSQLTAMERYSLKAQIGVFLDSIIEPKSDFSSAILYQPTGGRVVSGRVDERLVPNYYQIEGHAQRMDDNWGKSIYVSTHAVSYLLEGASANYVSVLRPVISTKTGAIVATAEINIDERTFSAIYEDITNGQELLLIDRSGNVISCKDKALLYTSVADQPYFEWAFSKRSGSQPFRLGGRDYLVNVARTQRVDWAALRLTPMHQLHQAGRRQAMLFIIFFAVSALAIVLSSIGIISAIMRPVTELVRSMSGAAQGDLSVQVKVLSDDELGVLGRSFNNMILKIAELIDTVSDVRLQKRDYQLLALQAQVSPHFLYNTLESVRALMRLNRHEDADSMLKSLEQFYRTSLSDGRTLIAIETELKNLRSYLAIQQVRYADKLTYTIDVDPLITDCLIVTFSLQPLVENAIYHGIRQKIGKGLIRIEGAVRDGEVVLSVIDDGPGFSVERAQQILSERVDAFGLYSVDQRLKLHFGPDYGVFACEAAEGARVEIRIPITRTAPEGLE